MFQGLRTHIVVLPPAKLDEATRWYTGFFGKKPYFEEKFYVGWNVGGFEFGLNPSDEPVKVGNNVLTYWGVAKIEKALGECVEKGAKLHADVQEVGEGIKVAVVADPFGNLFGLIENPGFKIEG